MQCILPTSKFQCSMVRQILCVFCFIKLMLPFITCPFREQNISPGVRKSFIFVKYNLYEGLSFIKLFIFSSDLWTGSVAVLLWSFYHFLFDNSHFLNSLNHRFHLKELPSWLLFLPRCLFIVSHCSVLVCVCVCQIHLNFKSACFPGTFSLMSSCGWMSRERGLGNTLW